MPTARARAPGAAASGAVVPSERQWVTQRPRSDEKRTLWTVGVTPVACRPQQTRDTAPWVAPQPNALVQLVQPQRLAGTCSLDAPRRVREVVATASGGTPCAAAGRRSTPCAAPSAAGNASQAGRHEPLNVLTLAYRQARKPRHRRPPAGRTRPVRAPRLASKIPPTHFRHTSQG